MARQTINVGTIANDGTGDSLRTAAVKMNSNFVELYTDLAGASTVAGTGDYNDLLNLPNIPSDISELTDTTNALVALVDHDYTVTANRTFSVGGVDKNLLNIYSETYSTSNTNMNIVSDLDIRAQSGRNVSIVATNILTLSGSSVNITAAMTGAAATFTGLVTSQDGSKFISVAELQSVVAASTDFSDFQTRVAAL